MLVPLDLQRRDDNQPSLFTSTPWLRVLADTYGYAFYKLVSEHQETILTPVRYPFGTIWAGLPFSDYSTALPREARAFTARNQAFVAGRKGEAVTLKMVSAERSPTLAERWRTSYLHQVDLQRAPPYSPRFLRSLRMARRHDLRVHWQSDPAHVRIFNQLLSKQRHRKFKVLPHPPTFLEAVYTHFIKPGLGWIVTVNNRKGDLLAAALVLVYRQVWYYKLGASLADALSYRPNHLLFDHIIHSARDRGGVALDLGSSGLEQTGLVQFKEGMSGVGSYIHTLRYFSKDWPKDQEKAYFRALQAENEALFEQPLSIPSLAARSKEVYWNYGCF